MSLKKMWGELEEDTEIDPNICKITQAAAVEMYIPKPYTIPTTLHLTAQQSSHHDTPGPVLPVPPSLLPPSLLPPSLIPPSQHSGQNTVLHAIDLIRHNRLISTQKRKLRNKISKTKGECEIQELMPVPNQYCKDLPQPANLRSSTLVKLREIPAISPQTADLLLKKAAAAILCHVGFMSSTSDALHLISHSLGNYLRAFCLQLRRQQDNILFGHKSSHTDVFEATLYEQGVGGYQEFISFAKSLVVDYVLKLDDRRRVIESEYAVITRTPKHSARSMPGHYPHVNTIDLLKGCFDPEPASPTMPAELISLARNTEQDDMIQSNGLFFH